VSIDPRRASPTAGSPRRPLTLNRAREQVRLYRDACAKYGKTPARLRQADIYVGESSAEARPWDGPSSKPAIAASTRRLVWGSVAEVVEKFAPSEPLGYTDIIVRHIIDNQAKGRRLSGPPR